MALERASMKIWGSHSSLLEMRCHVLNPSRDPPPPPPSSTLIPGCTHDQFCTCQRSHEPIPPLSSPPPLPVSSHQPLRKWRSLYFWSVANSGASFSCFSQNRTHYGSQCLEAQPGFLYQKWSILPNQKHVTSIRTIVFIVHHHHANMDNLNIISNDTSVKSLTPSETLIFPPSSHHFHLPFKYIFFI